MRENSYTFITFEFLHQFSASRMHELQNFFEVYWNTIHQTCRSLHSYSFPWIIIYLSTRLRHWCPRRKTHVLPICSPSFYIDVVKNCDRCMLAGTNLNLKIIRKIIQKHKNIITFSKKHWKFIFRHCINSNYIRYFNYLLCGLCTRNGK